MNRSEGIRISEDGICPVTKEPCKDECCPIGAICNVSSGDKVSGIIKSKSRIKNRKKLIAVDIPIEEAPMETKLFVDKGVGIVERIRARLNELKWTQKEFADKLGK